MKKTTLFAILFALVFASPSYAKWKKVSESVNGNTYYVDFERIRKHEGFVYFWQLTDLLKPDEYGELSFKVYKQGDCKLFQYKSLSYVYHKQPMGQDTGDTDSIKHPEWAYPPPSSANEAILKAVCSR
jgi:hypothetical protein